ncbi:RNA polymerase [Streptomyces sp. LX-29]|uniref:sigma factor-like helix-turn-helix DNA-binding protein n=1 Tax=Streptomyces sp. LX-29 TaxID=2900152 RepID=UPI00240DA8BC|nr:sigma factor-like helix-turn-helix DNA-binding protein [Streptomyces sp. LX-29]WFB07687.1 RNA polymerase [Streptomyces sp. LX-29]
MRERRAVRELRRAREFESFVAGAGGRLLRAATLLTGEPFGSCEAAERLLAAALARTYASWVADRPRGEDPYDRARRELAARFAHTAWQYRRPRGGVLGRLTPQERLVLVLRLYEGVAEEQVAAVLGLSPERVRVVCARAVSAVHGGVARPPRGARAPSGPGGRDGGPEGGSGNAPGRAAEVSATGAGAAR